MEISLPWMNIGIMTIVCFALGALWHGPLFGKIWMKIHHGDKKFSDDEMKKAMEWMWKIMLTEFASTLMMITTLAFLTIILPQFSGVHIAFLVWIWFILPTMTSTIIWWNDEKKWMAIKIAISSLCRLVGLLLAGYIFTL